MTHIDMRWSVKKTKQWLLSRCLPEIVHIPASFRPSSPVTFAVGDSDGSDGEYDPFDDSLSEFSSDEDTRSILEIAKDSVGDFDDFDDIDDLEVVAQRSPRKKSRKPREGKQRDGDSRSTTTSMKEAQIELDRITSPWALYSHSDGHQLEDNMELQMYKVAPFCLLEIHRIGAYVLFPRGQEYALPYFREDLIVAWATGTRLGARVAEGVIDQKKKQPSLPPNKWEWLSVRIAYGSLDVFPLGTAWGWPIEDSEFVSGENITPSSPISQQYLASTNYPYQSPFVPQGPFSGLEYIEKISVAVHPDPLFSVKLDNLVELGEGPGRTGAPVGTRDWKIAFARFREGGSAGSVHGSAEAEVTFAFPMGAEPEGRDTCAFFFYFLYFAVVKPHSFKAPISHVLRVLHRAHPDPGTLLKTSFIHPLTRMPIFARNIPNDSQDSLIRDSFDDAPNPSGSPYFRPQSATPTPSMSGQRLDRAVGVP